MKSEQFLEILNDTDDAMLLEAERPPRNKRGIYLRIATIAACCFLSLTLLLNVLMYIGIGYTKNKMSSDTYYPEASDADDKWGASNALDNFLNDSTTDASFEVKIIRTATLEAETKEYDQAIAKLQEAVSAAGGYVSDSSERNKSGTARFLTMTIRVPSEKLDEFLSGLGNVLLLTNKTITSNDVTLTYYDLAARLETLEAERTALTAMLSKAATTAEILAIQERLYDVIEEIESLETRIRIYDDQVAYATVKLTLSEVTVYTPKEETTFGEKIKLAFSESWESFGLFWQHFCIGVVTALPVLLVLGVLAAGTLLVIFLIRRRQRRENDKKT